MMETTSIDTRRMMIDDNNNSHQSSSSNNQKLYETENIQSLSRSLICSTEEENDASDEESQVE